MIRAPLLGLELRVMADRPRTYALRAVCGAALLLLFATVYEGRVSGRQLAIDFATRSGGLASLDPEAVDLRASLAGAGRALLFEVAAWLLIGVYVIQPVLMADAISGERQRGTLDLLRVAGLGPGRILVEKAAARMLPMIAVLLLSLPLVAVTYSMGGLGRGELLAVVWVLALAILQTGAIGLLASCLCATPLRALGLAALLAAALFGLPIYVGATAGMLGVRGQFLVTLFPTSLLGQLRAGALQLSGPGGWPILIASAGLLIGAHATLTSQGARPVGRPSGRPGAGAPVDRIGQLTALASVPVGMLCAHQLASSRPLAGWEVDLGLATVGALGLIAVGAAASAAVPSGRASGTLDLLLVTPLPGTEILERTGSPGRRVALGVLPLLAMLLVSEGLVAVRTGADAAVVVTRVALELTAIALLLSATLSLGTAWGLACGRRAGRAFAATLCCALGGLAGPLALAQIVPELHALAVLSPALGLALLEQPDPPLALAAAHTVGIGLLVLTGRALIRQNADRLLGRP